MAAAQGDFSIPEGFPALLKDFAKEPADVCAFAATYFADLAKQSAAPGGSTAPEQGTPQSPTAEEAFLVARRVDTAAAAAAAGLAGAALEVRGPSTAVCSTTTITNGS